MKKLMGMLTIGAMFFFGASNWVMAQDEAPAAAIQEETVAEATEEAVEATLEEGVEAATELVVESIPGHLLSGHPDLRSLTYGRRRSAQFL